jgi:hypothetical protein
MANRPVRTTCGWPMNVTRRYPHPQTFECQTREREIKRSSDRVGLPHPSDAAANISVG